MTPLLDQAMQKIQMFFAPAEIVRLVLLAGTSVFLIVILALHELLRPVDKRTSPPGKRWKLPPGPRGWPIVGNLFLYAKGEDGVGKDQSTVALSGEESTANLAGEGP